ncbi:alginate export family protein [Entomobacter blattae]|uniref:Alginate export n=1 Tax=Entomobacter blattae TaxID=2762277 RepID=A0A7H1NSH0_9PROT|nr:alginate export family protein [Entomobacter blattae]QNT78730.1 Alginate export [Entomobacter blattae]
MQGLYKKVGFCFIVGMVVSFSKESFAQGTAEQTERGPYISTLAFDKLDDGKEPWNLNDSLSKTRPKIEANRWTEKWAALYNPSLRTEPLDSLKYISLDESDPYSYISLGMNVRERYENLSSSQFGITPNKHDNYLLHRLLFHFDIRVDRHWQIYTQFEDVRPVEKNTISPVDKNKLDVRMAFVGYQTRLDEDSVLKARVGRQGFAFDLQRFVSLRQGPNVQQAFDAIWGDLELGEWRIIGILSHPVQYQAKRVFDDYSNSRNSFHMFRVERHVLGDASLSAYYARYEQHDTSVYNTPGNERRNIIDAHFAGKKYGVDWDVESMGQFGDITGKNIQAWAAAARLGYTFDVDTSPRIGIQFDSASGSHNPNGHTIGTFNPLYPNGYYFTLAGFTGYSNLVHLKPSFSFNPIKSVSLEFDVGMQWRETRNDAIYTQPNIPLRNTAGKGSHWSGVYEAATLGWSVMPNLSFSVMEAYYQVGDTIRQAGGHNSNYTGAQMDFAW